MLGKLITAMVTPFTPDNTVDLDAAARIAEHLIATGTDSIVLCGTTGESPTLSHTEELDLFSHIKSVVGKRAKLIAGTGSNCTQTAIKMTQQAAKIGLDATLQVTPYYNKPTQDGVIAHITHIASASDLPIMLYNIPSRTGTCLQPETIQTLSKIDTVVALKEAGGSLDAFTAIQSVVPADFNLYSGDDDLTYAFLNAGAIGVVSVASHLCGSAIKSMITLHHNHRTAAAREIADRLSPLFQSLFITTNPSPIKYALSKLGFNPGHPRLPLLPLTPNQQAIIDDVLQKLSPDIDTPAFHNA
jgi:4-hydroxy-tetrahydrodipicolinate synthase